MLAKQLHCPACGWQTICGASDLASRLRIVGFLRKDHDPDEAIVAELAQTAAPRMTCPTCKRVGLSITEARDADLLVDDDWQAAVLCEVCRQAIDPERLEFVPGTRRCVACQGKSEAGTLEQDEPEFCPKCGALVELRVSRGSGLTRYKRFCTGIPPCRL